jgi:hypothetical protein
VRVPALCDTDRVNQVWRIGWRAASTVLVVVAVWALLMILSRMPGQILDGPTVLTYLAAGCIFLVFVWSLGWLWRPYFPNLFPRLDA